MREKSAIRLKILSIVLMLAVGLTQSASGQILPAVNSALSQQESSSSQASEISFSLDANARLGGLTYVPKEWGEFHLSLQNDGNAPKELLCTSYFEGLSTLQFGRKVWLPARSRLVLSHPVLIPAADQFPDGRAAVRSLVIDDSQGKEDLVKSRSGQLQHDRTLLISLTDRHTGIVAGWNSTDVVPQDVVDLVVASRVYQGLNNKVTFLAGQFLPADETSLNYLDHLVLAEDRLVDDLAALTAVRRWLHSGGRLWIMLDRTGPALLERLFGDEFQGAVVDRVGLTSVRVDAPPSVLAPDGTAGESVEYDEPVEMTRMSASGMTVWNTVNGWPAALTRTYGEGRVLITTLGPQGWIKPTPPVPEREPDDDETEAEKAERERRALEMRSEFAPRSPMEDVAPFIFARREAEPLPAQALEPFVQEFISYDVPTGMLIIGSMCGFLVLLAATGTGLWWWGRLEHFGWCGSLLAVLFGLLFLGIGLSNRHGTSETIASIQFAQRIVGTDDVMAHGVLGVYRPEGSESEIHTSHGGELWPDMTGVDGTTRRMVTTDLGTFHWAGLSQPAGLGMYPVATSGAFPGRMEARCTLTAQGVFGQFIGQSAQSSDAVLATRQGRIGVQFAANGEFTANADDVMKPDQYLDSAFLNDVQNRRQRMLQLLFESGSWRDSLDQPQLLLWLDEWDHGFEFGDGLQKQGDTLLTVPLELSRPASGTEILIPSPLLSFATRQPPEGFTHSGFWDDDRREWQERSSPSTTWLNVQVPRALLPLQATKLQIEVMVSGLMGQIEILGLKDGTAVSLQTVTDPVGTIVFEIDDPDMLVVSDNGELSIGLSAGVPDEEGVAAIGSDPAAGTTGTLNTASPAVTWRVQSLALQLWATTSESAERTEK